MVDSVYDEGVYASIAVDRYDNPHIAYYDWSNGDLKYAYKGANGWIVETVESEGWVGWSTALALDASGRPHVSYHKCDDGTLRYAYRDADGTWHTEKIDGDQNNYTGDYTSIAVDSAGNPYIAYFVTVISNNEHLNYLKYARKTASGWQIQTVDVTEYVGCPSIALDSSGRPHISYYDGANYRLKYACLTPAQ